MKLVLLLGFMMAVNGLPTPQELLDRPDPFYGNSSGDGNDEVFQQNGGYTTTESDTSQKLENSEQDQVLKDLTTGYIEDITKENYGYLTKVTSEKLKKIEHGNNIDQVLVDVVGGYGEDISKQNDSYPTKDTSEKLEDSEDANDELDQVLVDVVGGYIEDISEQNEGYPAKDTSDKIEDSEDGNNLLDQVLVDVVGGYGEDISQKNNSDPTKDTSEKLEDSEDGNNELDQVLVDVVGGYGEDISQQNDSYPNKDTSEKLENTENGNNEVDQVLVDVVGGYTEDISDQNDDYPNKDTIEKLKNSEDGNTDLDQVLVDVVGEYGEDISEQNDDYPTKNKNLENSEDQSLVHVVVGYDGDISQHNDGYPTKDTSDKLENNLVTDYKEYEDQNDGYNAKDIPEDLDKNLPTDYKDPDNLNLKDVVTVEKDSTQASCASYTEDFGYMCVPYYQCRNGTIITDGTGLIDIRNGFGALDASDRKCPGFLDVCCKDPDFVAPPPKPQPYQSSCGRRNQEGLGARIVGFKEGESQVGEWPHMCALLKEEIVVEKTQEGYEGGEVKSSTINHFICGASLIAPGAVLTGAHCVNSYNKNDILKVRCGEWDTQTEDEPYHHQDRYVRNFEVHPGFKSATLHNDVAALFTTADFVMDHNIDTICLPEPGESFVDESCFATGWGKDKFGKEGQYQVILKEIDLPVVDFQQCEASLQQTRLGSNFDLHQSFLCAGGQPEKDTCKGDGGSPLVCPSKNNPNRFVQAGIVAWGIGCGDATPGVYADVSKAICFIDHVMACNGVAAGYSSGSHWGYSKEQCGSWIQEQIDDAVAEIPAGTRKRIVPAIKQSILSTWDNWLKGSCAVDYVDIVQQFARLEYKPSYNVISASEETHNEDQHQDQTRTMGTY